LSDLTCGQSVLEKQRHAQTGGINMLNAACWRSRLCSSGCMLMKYVH
jgi:hypothetical protein